MDKEGFKKASMENLKQAWGDDSFDVIHISKKTHVYDLYIEKIYKNHVRLNI